MNPFAGDEWNLVLVVAASILVASMVPMPGAGSRAPSWISIAAHLLGYGLLSLSIAAVLVERSPSTFSVASVAVVGAVAYGLGVESLQIAVPGRAFAPGDLLVNGVGATLGTLGWIVAARIPGRD